MRLLALGPCPILQDSLHETFRCEPQLYRVVSTLNGKAVDAVVSDSELPSALTAQLRERRVPIIGETLWATALRDATYQTKLLALLESIGLPVTNNNAKAEFSVVAWWNGLISNFHYLRFNAEHLLDKEHGPKVPSAWSVCVPLRLQAALVRRLVTPVYPFLSRAQHLGPFRLDCVLRDGVYVVGIYAGFTPDSDVGALEVVEDPLLYFFQVPTSSRFKHLDTFCTLHLSSPDAPIEAEQAGRHLHLSADRCDAVVSARGQDWREASRRVYRTTQRIKPSTIVYRTDLGAGFPESFSKLLRLGLL